MATVCDTVPGVPQKRLDEFLVWGRYMNFVLVFLEMMVIMQVGNSFYMIYAGAMPTISSCNNDLSTSSLTNDERCAMYDVGNCTDPVISTPFYSVNAEFNYLCGSMRSVKKSIGIQMFGVLLGSIVFGQLSDSFGRKKSLLISLSGSLISAAIAAFSGSLIEFTIARTVTGFFTGGYIAVIQVFIAENVPNHARLWINMVIAWSPNIVLFVLFAYLTHTWRNLTLLLAIINIPTVLMLFFVIQESPRWLIQKGRIQEARTVMNKIFKIDGRTDCNNELEDVLVCEQQRFLSQKANGKPYFYYHLFSTWGLTLITTVLSFTFFSTSLINFGILFNMEQMSGSLFWNNASSGLMRYACNLMCGFADYKFKWAGRKLVHNTGVFFVIIPLMVVVLAYCLGLDVQMALIIRIALLITLAMTAQVYVSTTITASEHFPTPVRNLGFSFITIWNRLGVVVSPFIFYLADYWVVLPFVVMIAFAIVDLTSWTFLLSETKGKPMLEHMPKRKEKKSNRWHLQDEENNSAVLVKESA